MAVMLATFLCSAVHVAVATTSHQLVGRQELQVDAYSSDGALTSNVLGTDHQGCTSIQPVSLWQKALHPWIGNYEHTTHCQEIAVLKNTAEPATCSAMFWMFYLTVCFGILVGIGLFALAGPLGPTVLLIPFAVAWYYMLETGLLADYRSGAMSWQVNFLKGAQPHNVSLECLQFVSATYALSIILLIYVIIFGCCFGLPMFVVYRMEAETHATKPFLSAEDQEFLGSAEFQKKCVKAFKDADEDHNGVLDFNELQHVLLFDLSDAEKQYVQESSLWKEAFEKCDEDNSKTIDQSEFVKVMKYVYTKAKYGAKKAEP